MQENIKISDIRAFVVETVGVGGDYGSRPGGHWIVDAPQCNPLSIYENHAELRGGDASSAVGSILVEIESSTGRIGYATGVGGAPACCVIEKHLKRFLIGKEISDTEFIWDIMFRASLSYGRAGIALLAISAVDLAVWDLIGRLSGQPVCRIAGSGDNRSELPVYCTGPKPQIYKELGFWGAKIGLPYGPGAGAAGFQKNIYRISECREMLGSEYPFMIDCYMGLDCEYASKLAEAVLPYDLYWIEEALPPDDIENLKLLKKRHPTISWTAGEHEYSRFGFIKLIRSGAVDILQPDLMWCGGMTEALRIAKLARKENVPVVPHAGGIYSYHFAAACREISMVEYCIPSLNGDEIEPVFGTMFDGEPLPVDGKIAISDRPGWGLELRRDQFRMDRPYALD